MKKQNYFKKSGLAKWTPAPYILFSGLAANWILIYEDTDQKE